MKNIQGEHRRKIAATLDGSDEVRKALAEVDKMRDLPGSEPEKTEVERALIDLRKEEEKSKDWKVLARIYAEGGEKALEDFLFNTDIKGKRPTREQLMADIGLQEELKTILSSNNQELTLDDFLISMPSEEDYVQNALKKIDRADRNFSAKGIIEDSKIGSLDLEADNTPKVILDETSFNADFEKNNDEGQTKVQAVSWKDFAKKRASVADMDIVASDAKMRYARKKQGAEEMARRVDAAMADEDAKQEAVRQQRVSNMARRVDMSMEIDDARQKARIDRVNRLNPKIGSRNTNSKKIEAGNTIVKNGLPAFDYQKSIKSITPEKAKAEMAKGGLKRELYQAQINYISAYRKFFGLPQSEPDLIKPDLTKVNKSDTAILIEPLAIPLLKRFTREGRNLKALHKEMVRAGEALEAAEENNKSK